MEKKFTIQEIKNYLLTQDSLGDVLYNLTAEKIEAANSLPPEDEDSGDEYLNPIAIELGIEPIRETGGGCTAKMSISYDEIVEMVGPPNVTDLDDPDKVKASWGFQDRNGRQGFIWCYKYYGNPVNCNYWSVDGDLSLMRDLFPGKI